MSEKSALGQYSESGSSEEDVLTPIQSEVPIRAPLRQSQRSLNRQISSTAVSRKRSFFLPTDCDVAPKPLFPGYLLPNEFLATVVDGDNGLTVYGGSGGGGMGF